VAVTTLDVWEVFRERVEETTKPVPHPIDWCKDKLGDYLWSKQGEILQSIIDNRKTAVPACHESSKSFTAGRAASWWIDGHPPGSAMVVTTAPGHPQVKGILWKEINRAHKLGGLVGRVNQTEWWIGNEMVGIGRKPNDYDPDSFQGFHAPFMLVVIDEACGVEGLWEAAESMVANENGRILAIGNPTDPTSTFAQICKPGSGWNVIHIDALETPNFTGEQIPKHIADGLVSKIYEEEIRTKYGVDSPVYISRVRGRFPEDASDGVIPFSWVKACQKLDVDLSQGDVELGMDVGASEAGDPTVIREWLGNKAGRTWEVRTSDPESIVGFAVQKINDTGAKRIKVDVIGIGFGIAGWIEKEGSAGNHNASVVKINVAERPLNPKDRKRFKNKRAQMWWMGRELSQGPNPGWDLSNVSDECLAQLIAPRYEINSAGQIVVEDKDEIRKRTGRSPDDAEALLLGKMHQSSGSSTANPARMRLNVPNYGGSR
jgi:hypothetical protein